jgi:hypothetical protein
MICTPRAFLRADTAPRQPELCLGHWTRGFGPSDAYSYWPPLYRVERGPWKLTGAVGHYGSRVLAQQVPGLLQLLQDDTKVSYFAAGAS